MAKRGAKKLPAEELRTERVGAYLTPPEMERWLNLVFPKGTDGLSDAAINRALARRLRQAMFSEVPPDIPVINQQAFVNLGRAGSNFNQAITFAHRIGDVELEDAVRHLKQQTDNFRLALVGLEPFDDEGSDEE